MYSVLRTLKTSSIAAIVERLRPLLHIDPVAVLPPEITSEIFSYLTPSMLLEASRASKAWRESTLDGRLWKQKFNLEGWGLDMEEVRNFEQKNRISRMDHLQRARVQVDQQRQNKRPRAEVDGPEECSSSRQSWSTSNMGTWKDRHTIKEEEAKATSDLFNSNSSQDEVMHDAIADSVKAVHNKGFSNTADGQLLSRSIGGGTSKEENESPQNTDKHHSVEPDSEMERQEDSTQAQELTIHTASGHSRLNYHYVFKQKRKLEDNWNAGSYKSFQLPHRDYPEEAHSECVYTIQYIGKYLVSGSRDRTLRIWDLDTQRLVRKPLIGHTASVLCLQFDNRENEDIIISGSSDTDVILWRFSTGKMLRKIPQAHRESVLNLKFDHRYLVTCSKDKTIKIWSRHELRPGDRDYPVRGVQHGGKCPAYIVDLGSNGGSIDMDSYLTPDQRQPLKPYTPLMLIDSHGAAVNAIHIYHDQLVSASGDRYVKLFDIHTGVCTAICRGHTKGIACVQYDGKRIVSGSSDNTIRIYDPATQAEVACLQGHHRLVRTIQSAFGDFPDSSREQLEMEANEVDQQYYDAQRAGTLATKSTRNRGRNAGSKQPRDIMALGAKLPPGGGGSRWGRIISGSYDETIIIWKKASDGRWVMGHRLRQEEALRAAGGPLLSQSDIQPQQPHNTVFQNGQGNNQQTNQAPPNQPQMNGQGWQNPMSAPQPTQQAIQTGVAAVHAGLHGSTYLGSQPNTASAQLLAYEQRQMDIDSAAASGSPAPNAANAVPTGNTQSMSTTTLPPPLYQQQPLTGLAAAAQNGTPQIAQNPPAPQPQVANAGLTQPNARVFKLQFDARRIICCSQDPKIVGWDFANGDERIIECTRFFHTPQ